MSKTLTYQFDYCKTSRGTCHNCRQPLKEQSLKIGQEQHSRHHDGIEVKWNHIGCIQDDYNFQHTKLSEMKNWEKLKWDDLKLIKSICFDDYTIENEAEMKKRNKLFYENKEKLNLVQPKILKNFLIENGFEFGNKVENDVFVYHAANLLTFGVLQACPECKQRKLSDHLLFVKCYGNVTEYVKCEYIGKNFGELKRYKAILSDKIKKADKKGILKNWEFPENYPTEEFNENNDNENNNNDKDDKNENNNNNEIINEEEDELMENNELYGMKICIHGTPKHLGCTVKEMKQKIQFHGGEIVTNAIDASVCLTTEEDMKKCSSKLLQESKDILTCLTIEWFNEIIKREDNFMELRKKEKASEYLCENCEWKTDIVKQRFYLPKTIQKKKKPLDDSEIMTVHKLNNLGKGTKVYTVEDPIYGWTTYNVMLNLTDIDTGKNSFYHMQIVKKARKYQLLFEWGRIGDYNVQNTIKEGNINELLVLWNKKFKDNTGNEWEKRSEFKQIPRKYFMQQLDDGNKYEEDDGVDDEEKKKQRKERKEYLEKLTKEIDLDDRVCDLIEMIFDEDMMKYELERQGLNINQMPLGKITTTQMKEAMKILKELHELITGENEVKLTEKEKNIKMKDLSGRYYNLIPHVMSAHRVNVIEEKDVIDNEMELIQTMYDVAEVMELLKEDEDLDLDEMAYVYKNYISLNTKITALDKKSERYKMINQLFTNNQEKNAYMGKAKVNDIFEIERNGEEERFKDFEEDDNRQLLYHGSRLTNFVGILSKGLLIAPPEAPPSGYRFGKGIYFADCISKSLMYCTTNKKNLGCMLLCDVALGKQWETTVDRYMEKPETGYDSTYALGRFEPDPKKSVLLDDGCIVNKGKMIEVMDETKTDNHHSEYIVYDIARVKIRYLVTFKN